VTLHHRTLQWLYLLQGAEGSLWNGFQNLYLLQGFYEEMSFFL